MRLSPPSAIRGFTLIEVLIAFIILSFGLLGAVALQAKAKQASFDSLQRAAAVSLGNDIIQRIRANDTGDLISNYDVDFTSEANSNSSSSCFGAVCNSAQIANLDKAQWKRAIRASENTGSLEDARVCINPSQIAGTGGKGFNVEVIITWQGRQKFKATETTQDIQCGVNDDKRRLVVLNSYVYVRS